MRTPRRRLKFEVDELPATSYAADLRAGMDSGAADYGVDLLYSIPPADVVPNAVEIVTEPGTGVEIEVVHRAVLQAIAIVSRAPRGNGGTVEKRRARHPGAEARVAITLTLDRAREMLGDADNSTRRLLPDGVRGGRRGGRAILSRRSGRYPQPQSAVMVVGYWISQPHDNRRLLASLDGDQGHLVRHPSQRKCASLERRSWRC